MIGEVGLTDSIKTRNGSLEIIVYPDTSHGIVDCRIDHHWLFPWRRSSDLFIHLEQVSVTLGNSLVAESLDSVSEIKEYGKSSFIHTETGVASFLGCTGGYVTRHEVTECRVTALEIVVAILFRNLGSLDLTLAELFYVLKLLRYPDTSVVTERL